MPAPFARAQPASDAVDTQRASFRIVLPLGRSQYSDPLWARGYGETERDVIYKIDYDKACLLVRFLYHIHNRAWRLIHINLKTENDEALEWVHACPK